MSLSLDNIREEMDSCLAELPDSPPPPETPKEPMEFLARSWSISALEVCKALAPLKLHCEEEDEVVEAGELTNSKVEEWRPFTVGSSQTSQLVMDNILSQSLNKQAKPEKSWRVKAEKKGKKKDKYRAQNAEVQAAMSVGGVAAAVAAVAAATARCQDNGGQSKTSMAVASAAALVAAQCVEKAVSMGADRRQLASLLTSAVNVKTPGDIVTLTAGAATGFSQQVAVDLRFSARKDGNLVTSEMCRGILNTLTWRLDVKWGKMEFADKVFEKSPERNAIDWNASLSGSVKNGRGDDVLELFWAKTERNVVSWTTMNTGHAQKNCMDKALLAGSKQRICSSFSPDLLAEIPLLIQPDLLEESQEFQIQVKLLGKTRMHWVRATDLVQDLLQKLECQLGIPSSLIRLLYKGKQLLNPLPLSFYSIHKDASIEASFRLRGGSFGQTSSAPFFSYKDAASKDAAQPQSSSKTAHPNEAPKPFLVDKSEEIPSLNFTHPEIENRLQIFEESALICRFNGLWPRTADLYQWIHSTWTKKSKIYLCSKGFFIVVFDSNEDYQKALMEGPWFWGAAGLFLTPWFPDFDPSTAVITKLPIWVRLPNLPAHLWHASVFIAIAESLGRYLTVHSSRKENGLYTYGRLCAEIDISKGLPDQINLKIGDFHWTQTLDYENTAFRCRHCHQTGHLQNTCSQFLQKKKNLNRKPKSKRWNPCEPPRSMYDLDFSSSGEEETEDVLQNDEATVADVKNDVIPMDTPSDAPAASSNPQLSQKRTHLSSSSDSDKEILPPMQNSLQIVMAQPNSSGWVKVNKKKGKKYRVARNDSSG